MKKQRHNKDKPQNNYGGDYQCPLYDKLYDGTEFCHDEFNLIFWNKTIDGKLICKGNLYNCKKLKYKFLASVSDKNKLMAK